MGYDDVALIVNDNSEMSMEIGTYFAEKRGVPRSNIINISVPEKEIITFSEFDELARQVKENLSKRGLTDRIDYMVTTKGVPLKVTSGVYNMNHQEYYESASVDSELMLLDSQYEGQIHRRWWAENPYAASGEPFSRDDYGIRLVTRLTGFTKEEAMALVDRGDGSIGSRGNAFLDMDPSKNGSSGYKQGNIWMTDAHTWLVNNGHPSSLESTRDFQTGKQGLMAYYSWGSNDGDWSEGQMSNGGFEYGTGEQASGWTYVTDGGVIERTSENHYGGSWSLKAQRNGTGVLRAYQDIGLNYLDHRYLPDARMSLSGVSSPGARILLEGYDNSSTLIWSHELANRSGDRGFDAYQDPLENDTRMVRIRFIVELLGEGTAYFDNLNLRVIRPHNTWVNGSIAETIVSTGGRSMTYGTWYGQSLVADIIRDGVTGIKGYTWEPFITAVSRAHILFPAYYQGFSLAESFWMASPYVSWMGTVIGDPKVTPFINERPDMGPSLDRDPLYTWVDEKGTSWLTLVLHNKGGRTVEQGKVKLYMEGGILFHERTLDLGPNETIHINISSEDAPILGPHRFRAELDPDDEVWEYDETNNEIVKNLTVNHRPELDISISTNEVRRTESLRFFINITDMDMDPSTDRLDLVIEGPGGDIMEPELVSFTGEQEILSAVYSFSPPWNSTLGFYSVRGHYTDPEDSYDEEVLFGAFKVVNFVPSLIGSITSDDVPRGGQVDIELEWDDPDTPDGSLEMEAHAEDPMGSEIDPDEIRYGSNHNATLIFSIPPEYPARTWQFFALVQDKDGGYAEWSSLLRTYNREPTLEVLEGVGSSITRLEQATFRIRYTDPEGQPSDGVSVTAYGPEGAPSTTVIYQEDHDLRSNEELELRISGFGLQPGNYTLEIEYSDDQSLGDILVLPSALEIVNMPPTFENITVNYPLGEGEPGGILMRGESITFTLTGMDPDGSGDPLEVSGHLIRGSQKISVRFDARGSSAYGSRVSTDGSWDVGEYSLSVELVDADGAVVRKVFAPIFHLDAEMPTFQFGEVRVDLNLSADIEVILGKAIGATEPTMVEAYFLDINGSGIIETALSGQSDIWTGHVQLERRPETVNIRIIDELNRSTWVNGSVSLEIEEEPASSGSEDTTEENGNDLFLILLILLATILVLMALLILVLLAGRKREDTELTPAPPMGAIRNGDTGEGLPQSPHPSLPPSGGGDESNTALPPGKELIDGSSYHRPETRGNGAKEKSPGDRQVFKEPGGGMSLQEEHSKPTNTGSVVEPSKQDVQHTNDPDIGGDTGEGEKEVRQGPGGGPGLQVQDAEAQQGKG
ncbi:MAG: TIGR03790 family protein [Thermoplasmatota archaeon]